MSKPLAHMDLTTVNDVHFGETLCGVIEIDLPGVKLAMIDTVRPGFAGGSVYDDDLEWLDELASRTDVPLLIFGHHQIWDPRTPYRSEDYFGIQPDESEKFIDMITPSATCQTVALR